MINTLRARLSADAPRACLHGTFDQSYGVADAPRFLRPSVRPPGVISAAGCYPRAVARQSPLGAARPSLSLDVKRPGAPPGAGLSLIGHGAGVAVGGLSTGGVAARRPPSTHL